MATDKPEAALFYPSATQRPLLAQSFPGLLAMKSVVVMHITVGSSVEGAYQTFKASKRIKEGGRGRTSAHFCIGRKGDVWQFLPISDIGFHASAVNEKSIGIEHVAIPAETVIGGKTYSQPVTEEQYISSAALVKWLCEQMRVPCDRQHVRGHNEASPRDKHTACCSPTLDLERVVREANQTI